MLKMTGVKNNKIEIQEDLDEAKVDIKRSQAQKRSWKITRAQRIIGMKRGANRASNRQAVRNRGRKLRNSGKSKSSSSNIFGNFGNRLSSSSFGRRFESKTLFSGLSE